MLDGYYQIAMSIDTLYQMCLKKVATTKKSTIVALPEDVSSEVITLRFNTVIKQMMEMFTDLKIGKVMRYFTHATFYLDRSHDKDWGYKYKMAMFHNNNKLCIRGCEDELALTTGLVFELFGYENNGDSPSKIQRRTILKSMYFRRVMKMMNTLSVGTIDALYERFEEEEGEYVLPMIL